MVTAEVRDRQLGKKSCKRRFIGRSYLYVISSALVIGHAQSEMFFLRVFLRLSVIARLPIKVKCHKVVCIVEVVVIYWKIFALDILRIMSLEK